MSQLSYAQLEGVWLQAAAGTKYATKAWAALMAAIGMAESDGETDVTNPNDNGGKQTSWGVWQISNGDHSQPSATWNNPYTNAQLALGKLQDQGLSAWGTYTSGAYKAFLSNSTTPTTAGLTGGSKVAAAYLAAGQAAQSDCLWKLGQLTVPVVPGLYSQTISPGWCILSRSQARAVLGMSLMAAGGIVTGLGVTLLVIVTGAGPVAKQAQKLLGQSGPVGQLNRRASGGAASPNETRSEDELRAAGASDLAEAQRPAGTMRAEIEQGTRPPVRPGRRTGARAAPSKAAGQAARRRAQSARRSAAAARAPRPAGRRVAGARRPATERPPTRAEAGF